MSKDQSPDKSELDVTVKQVERAYSAASENIKRYQASVAFNLGDQWDPATANDYDIKSKPRLTFNRVYAYIKTVIGEMIQSTPDFLVRSTSIDTPQENVDLLSGIVRHIAYDSKLNEIVQHAGECQLMGGFGAIRVTTDYESDQSFNQVVKLIKVDDPTQVYFDPDAEDLTKSDGDYCGILSKMTRKKFNKLYPDAKDAASFDASEWQDDSVNWGDEDYITLCDHYVKEYYSKSLIQMSDGHVVEGGDSDVKEYYDQLEEQHDLMAKNAALMGQAIPPFELPTVENKRTSKAFKIMHYKLCKTVVLEETEWPSKYLPLVYVDGDTFIVNGKKRVHSYTAFAEDAQRFYNFLISNIAETLKANRKEQWILTPDNIEGKLAAAWKNPELTQGALIAKPDKQTGQLPQKVPPSEIPSSLLGTKPLIESDIQSIIGRYEAAQGSEGQEVSGVALATRIMQNNAGINKQMNNLNRAIEQVGRCILDLLPTIYDTERTVTIQTKKGEKKPVVINQHNGMKNPVNTGDFDIEIEAGANFAIQKAEALDKMVQLCQINPEVFPMIADLIAENIDLENTNEIVSRLETILPPAIQAKKKGLPPPPPQPNPQQQMMQQQMQVEQQKLQLEQQKLQLEAQVMQQKSAVETAKNQMQALKIQATVQDNQQKTYVATQQAQAQALKANAEIKSAGMNALAQMAKTHADIAKSHAVIHKARGQSTDGANMQRK